MITLFAGFVVILVNDLGGPAWLMAVLGIFAIAVGRRAVGLIKARRHPPAREPEPNQGADIRPDQREVDEPANWHGNRH